MAISVDELTHVITIPKADLTLVSGTLYSMDTDAFRLELKDWEDCACGIVHYKTHEHNTEVTIAGVTYARAIRMLAPYSITFENGLYSVRLEGSNNNIWDIEDGILNQNTVQVIPTNSAGLIVAGSGIIPSDLDDIANAVWDEDLTDNITVNSASTALRATSYGGVITLDTVNGVAGTGWPIGTQYKPVNNLTDALTIMLYGNVDELVLLSDLTIEATHDVSNKVIKTIGKMGTAVIFATGCTANNTTIKNANISGVITLGDELLIYDSSIGELSNFTGIMNNVAFSQGAEITLGSYATIIQATAGGEPTNEPELSINGAAVNISHWTGNLKLTNKTGSNRTVLNCASGNIIIDSTCTTGTIQILGLGQIEQDNSGAGCNVDIDAFISTCTISDAVWDSLLTDHEIADTFGKVFADMIKLLGYKVTKTGNIITIYESDEASIWRQYDLSDGGRLQL